MTALLRSSARAFLLQGIGIVGLAWCLAVDLPVAATALAVLVLVDQAVFLRGRRGVPGGPDLAHRLLDGWCLVVSATAVVLFLATALRSLGVQDGAGRAVADPLSCLALALASVAHADVHLAAVTGGGRLLVACAALLGDAATLAFLALLLRPAAAGTDGRSR